MHKVYFNIYILVVIVCPELRACIIPYQGTRSHPDAGPACLFSNVHFTKDDTINLIYRRQIFKTRMYIYLAQ